jgi:methionine-gamma-lyase
MQDFNPEQALLKAQREFGEFGGVSPSIERASTFTVMKPDEMSSLFDGTKGPDIDKSYLYSRHFNPTVNLLSRYLAAMEGTEAAVCTASGMSAISCALMQLCKAGDHIVSSNAIYGGTYALLEQLLPEMNITTTFVDPENIDEIKAAITPETKVIFTEIAGNPTLKIADIPAIAKVARNYNLTFVVDNTFMPMVVSPALLGADIVVYSMTKFINGASDLLAGAICADKSFINKLMDLHTGRIMLFGPTMDPRSAFDIIQRLPHLALRMKEHGRRAQAIAEALFTLNVPVTYPGLPSFRQHETINALVNKGYGYGGLLTIDCLTQEKANELLSYLQNDVQFGLIAVSLGYFDTLMSCSGATTASEITTDDQLKMGLSNGLVRMSIGLTGSLKERVKQIETAVKALRMNYV